jgi:DNA repair exonuclease SbcCD ATPase subunit
MCALPLCPNCKAEVLTAERVYQVTVEPEQGERGITKRDVGMFRCPRCDVSFPRVLGKKHYLIVAETEYTRVRKDSEDLARKNKSLEQSMEALKKEQFQREEALKKQLRGDTLAGLETELGQLERHVEYLRTERDRLQKEAEAL